MKKVKIFGKECELRFSRYRNNDTVSIQAYRNGRAYCTCTVNAESLWQGVQDYRYAMQFPVVVIKNYSENEGMVKALVDAGVILPGAYIAGTTGTIQCCILTEEWKEIAIQQLSKLQY